MPKRKRPDGLKVKLGRSALIGGGHVMPWPYLKITLRKSRLVGLPAWVLLKRRFGGNFKARDKVLRLHVTGKSPRDLVHLFRELKAIEPELKAKGFKGMYADTPTKVIAKALEMQGWATMPTPRVRDELIRLIAEERRDVTMHSTRVIKRFETE